jgi:hypothetical protein
VIGTSGDRRDRKGKSKAHCGFARINADPEKTKNADSGGKKIAKLLARFIRHRLEKHNLGLAKDS